MRIIAKLFAVITGLCLSMLAYAAYYYDAPGPLSEPKAVLFKRGMGFEAIVDKMADEGVIRHPLLFKVMAVAVGDARKFKAGEYDFSATITPKLVMDMIAEGRVVVHKVTLPEGFSVREVVELLAKEPLLEGDVPQGIEEGSLLPETYHFTYGDSRAEVIGRMQNGMRQTMNELWSKRAPDLPFTKPEQAATLASIVEKETGVASERGRVAAVFINRLRLGMPLQSDPTVAYGIEKQLGKPMERSLTLSDLRSATEYNTYVIPALPPAPIANFGRAALEAVLNPPQTKELYFVATGTGGHNFATTLAEHNANVAAYRAKLKQR
ncbi:MAG: endolytic transglycosylase MltG [Alphaproteobacteria bacterium]|nr:endolytic transglycosylase MltG [Alphaproteobacteria bacterium]